MIPHPDIVEESLKRAKDLLVSAQQSPRWARFQKWIDAKFSGHNQLLPWELLNHWEVYLAGVDAGLQEALESVLPKEK